MRGLALCSKECIWHEQLSHNRPRWVFIAHTQKLAVGGKTLKKSARAVVPPFIGWYYRTSTDCMVTAIKASKLAVENAAWYYCQRICGSSVHIGRYYRFP